jgi:hypothetical protein
MNTNGDLCEVGNEVLLIRKMSALKVLIFMGIYILADRLWRRE